MNLNDIVSKIKSLTDYSPELQSYKDQMVDIANDAYFTIWNSKRWKFAQVKDAMKIYPDLSFGNTSKTVSVVNGSRMVVFSGAVPMLTAENTMGPYSSQSFSTAYGSIGSAYEGEIFQIGGREYNIIKVVSQTEIHLDEQYRGGTIATSSDWKIKKRYYDLPDDCLELLNLSHRDVPNASGGRPPYGKISGLSKRKEEEFNLREDFTATYAECYIDTAPVNVPPAEKFTKISDDANLEATIPSDYYLELCWAFHYWGAKLGPLSEPFLFKTASAPQPPASPYHAITLQFTSFDDKPIASQIYNFVNDRVPNKYEGLRKVLFFNQNINPVTGKRLGIPCWRMVSQGAPTGLEGATVNAGKPLIVDDELSQCTLLYVNSFNPGNPRYVEWDGSIPRIRPYPRIVGFDVHNNPLVGEGEAPGADEEYFRRLEVRYFKKPLRMALATDVPQMPHEFHNLVVLKALEDVYNKSGNLDLADRYAKKIEKEIKILERRYLDSIDTSFVRGSFSNSAEVFPIFDQNSLKLAP